ncbi:unnamed protein product, partial [Symbiodinium sp. CCMP2456]
EPFSPEAAIKAGGLGAALLKEAGGIEEAVKAVNNARVQRLGDYFKTAKKAWKDAAYGAALFVDPNDPAVEELLRKAQVAESPLGRVPKQNPDRTISSQDRPFNDMRRQNEASLKGAPKETSPGPSNGTFFARSPGEFVAWSSAARSHHGAHRPNDPAFDDVVPFESKWLMDDGVAVEPMVGTRIQQSLDLLDATMKLVWGPEGVNVEKMAEEGEPYSTSQLLWGLHMDFDDLTVTLPEPKRIKAKYLLSEPALARGNRQLPLGLLQEVIGCAQYWSVVCPELVPHLPSLYHLLKGNLQGTGKSAKARKQDTYLQVEAASEREETRRWEDFWDALDFVRLQLESPLTTSFSSAFEKLLPLRERLALPGVTARTRVTGGDATVTRIGALDWKSKAFHASETGQYVDTLRKMADAEDELEIISIMELLAFVVLACERGDHWHGELVLYVTDNANVRSWLFKRRPSNRTAGLLIRLVQRLEAERGFTVHPIYIRTYRNQLADWLSREDLQQASQELERQGWVNGDERVYLLKRLKEEARWRRLLVDAPRHLDGEALGHLVLAGIGAEEAARMLPGTFVQEPNIVTTGDPRHIKVLVGGEIALRELAREPGWQVAATLLGLWVEGLRKAGNCLDPDETQAWQQMEIWLAAWQRDPECSRNQLQLISAHCPVSQELEPSAWQTEPDTRAGGASRTPEDKALVAPALLGDAREAFFRDCGLPSTPQVAWLDQVGQDAALSKLADSTRRSYNAGWKQWSTFMSGTGVPAFLCGETRAEKQLDETWLVRFVVFLHETMGRTAQGIRQRLSGIRYAHIAAGYPDPSWVPVTPAMLGWIFSYLRSSNRPESEKEPPDECFEEADSLAVQLRVGVTREQVSELLRVAAVALGYPAHLVASHSLRKGGATAMLSVTDDVEVVKRFGGWKSDAIHAYLYTDMAHAPERASQMLRSQRVLQPRQTAGPTTLTSGRGTRCGGPKETQPHDWEREEFETDDEDWRSAQAKLEETERRSGLTFVQRVRLRRQIAAGGVVEPPTFLQRFGGIREWFEAPSQARGSQDPPAETPDAEVAAEPPVEEQVPSEAAGGQSASASVVEPYVREEPNDLRLVGPLDPLAIRSNFASPTPALPLFASPAMEARPAAGMGRQYLRTWVEQWGSAWKFMQLSPGAPPSDVMKAFKKLAIRLHPDKAEVGNREEASVKFQALGNAKEILLTPTLRVLHDNMVGTGPTGVPPPPSVPSSTSRGAVPKYGTPMWGGEPSSAWNVSSDEEYESEEESWGGHALGKHPPQADASLQAGSTLGRTGHQQRILKKDGGIQAFFVHPDFFVFGVLLFGETAPASAFGYPSGTFFGKNRRTAPAPKCATAPKSAVPPKAPPAAILENAIRWFCCVCGEANRLNRYACNGCNAGRWKHEHHVERATHWVCTQCRAEVTIKLNRCPECDNWRSRGAELINNGQSMEVLSGHPRAAQALVVLDRRQVVDDEKEELTTRPLAVMTQPQAEILPMGPRPPAGPEYFNIGIFLFQFEDDFYRAAPGGGSTASRPQSYYPGFFAEAEMPEEEPKAPPPAAPRKARPLTAKTVKPLAIVVPNGEALWFTLRKVDSTTPRLAVPWSVFQYLLMSDRVLSGFHSWGSCWEAFIKDVAQDVLFFCQEKRLMSRLRAANEGVPPLVDLTLTVEEPEVNQPLPSASQVDPAELFRNPMGKWTATALGSESAVDPAGGDGADDGAQDAEADLDDELNDDEKAEVRRIEKECTDLEKQLRGLTATQQRAFLERLADNSVPVAIRASQATADQDPKYLVERAEVGHVVAFQRAPGALAPMMSLGREHRLRLLRRLHELERAGVEWTQEEIEASLTMEQFLDYIEEREQEKADRVASTTASKAAGPATGGGTTPETPPPAEPVVGQPHGDIAPETPPPPPEPEVVPETPAPKLEPTPK